MSNTLQVGQTYTSQNGSEWECIFVRGGKAWMLGVYSDGVSGSAYEFNINGTAEWAGGHGCEGYDIKWEPKRETIIVMGGVVIGNMECTTVHPEYAYHRFNMQVDTLDGTPDWTTAKLTPCD